MTGALLAASAVYWGLRLFVTAPGLPVGTVVATMGAAGQGDLTRLLGADAPAPSPAAAAEPPPDARFQLIGVVTPRLRSAAGEGLALIAVDGKPARAYRVGSVVDGQTVLKTVAPKGAQLGPREGAALIQLQLAAPTPAATSANGAPPALASAAPNRAPAAPMASPQTFDAATQARRRLQAQPVPAAGDPPPMPEGFQTH